MVLQIFLVFSAAGAADSHTVDVVYHKRFLSERRQGPQCCRGETRLITMATPHTVAMLCNAALAGKATIEAVML